MENPFLGGSGKKKKTREYIHIPQPYEGFLFGTLEIRKDGYHNEIKEITSIRNRNGLWKVFFPEGYLVLKEGIYRFKKVDNGYVDQDGNLYELNV